MVNGWAKLYRSIFNWEYYEDDKIFKTFITLLLLANWKDKKWQGVMIKRGQFATSRSQLARKLGYSESTIERILSKLQESGNITIKANKQFRVITICKYETWQKDNYVDDTTTDTSNDTSNDTLTDTSNDTQLKNIRSKERKKEEYYITDTNLKSLNEWEQPLTKDQAKKIETKYSDYGDILESYLFKIANWKGKNKSVYLTLRNWIDKDIQNGVLKVKVTRIANY